MLILKPHIFKEFPEITFGFSTKYGDGYEAPYFFNLSLSVDDDRETVLNNRKSFFRGLGLEIEQAAFQKQVHGDTITYMAGPGNAGESDAMITDKPNTALCISTADCTSIFIYDPVKKIIAGIHSGWRGTQQRITAKALGKLELDFGCSAENLFVYLGPSVSQVNYEVGTETAVQFDQRYVAKKENKLYLDVAGANYDMIINAGVPSSQVQQSVLCSYEYKELLHSYRRDGRLSGRAMGVIALNEAIGERNEFGRLMSTEQNGTVPA